MIYINAFLFCGLICLLGEIILDNTNLTPGHVTSLLVVLGAILSFFGLYQKFIAFAGTAASIPITSFGNILYQACLEGYKTIGVLGMFTNLLTTTSGGISGAVIFAFITTLFCKSKD